MSVDIHAVALGTPQRPGGCCWAHAFEDVLLRCFAAHFPGEPDCVDHFIARVQASPDPDARPAADVRSFGPSVVSIDEVTAQ